MAEKLLLEIEATLRKLCAERSVPLEELRFFGSRTGVDARDDSDVDVVLISAAFAQKDIFTRTQMMKGVHRALVQRFDVPFDLVFCSPDEWQHSSSPLLQGIRRVA